MEILQHRLYLCLLIGSGILLATGCESDPFPVDVSNGQSVNRRLKVTTHHYYLEQGTVKDSLLPEVRVILYRTENDRLYNQDVAREATTDSLGFTEFQYISDTFFYIKAINLQRDSVLEEVRIPPQAVTINLNIDFL